MEFMIAWFWLVKLALGLFAVYIAYKAAWVNKLKSKFWNIFLGVVIVVGIVMPVKIESQTRPAQVQMNSQIEQTKELPPKVTDNSFKENSNIEGITSEDLK